MNLVRSFSYVLLLTANAAYTATAQIAQDKPELCGTKGQPVPLPSNISAVPGGSGVFSTLFLKTGELEAPMSIQLTMGTVEEVCPVSRDRLLVFGDSNPAVSIAILDQKAGTLLDSFYAYSPAVSPNQHWLVFRDFYPPMSEVPWSEEYMLYDLTKDKAQNRSPGLTPYTADVAGRVIYPVVDQNVPFEHSGLPQNQTHRFRSESFYWSDDSRMLLFADSVQKDLSIVLITIEGGQTSALVHKLAASEVCEQGSKGDIAAADVFLSDAEISSTAMRLQFRSSDYGACKPMPLILTRSDFEAAIPEVHAPQLRKGHSTLEHP